MTQRGRSAQKLEAEAAKASKTQKNMVEISKSADNIKQRRSGHHSKKKKKAVGNEAVLINVVSTEDTQQQMLNTKETADFI